MYQKEDLIYKLCRSAALSKRKRLIRVITNPWKMLYPEFLRLTNRTCEINVRTFWSGETKVILPEYVSTFIWRYGFYEEDMCIYMLNFLQKGMTFIDVGAHFGFFTLLGSYLVESNGRILSIEPTPNTFLRLKNNVSEHTNVKIYNCAAFSSERELIFNDYGLVNSGYNSIFGQRKVDNPKNSGNEILVQARKVDDIVKENAFKSVDFIKIDAESSEIHVLEGMRQTLSAYKPKIVIEVGDYNVPGAPQSKEAVEWLERISYMPYEVLDGKVTPHCKKDTYKYSNLLFMAK